MTTYTGTSGNDSLTGGVGNDTLLGLAGNDYLIGGAGNDMLDGGSGVDTVAYADASGSVNANLTLGSATGAGVGTDNLFSLENIVGSSYDDTLIGNTSNNSLSGSAGNDVLIGDAGNDTLYGDAGNDTLSGGAGSDTLSGGAGNDMLDGGADSDTVQYSDATSAVVVNLALGTATGFGTDSLLNMESAIGSAFNDTLIGDANNNVLVGNAGTDTLVGDAGHDTLSGGDGNDTLVGGAGSDTAQYTDATGAVTVNLALGTATGLGVGSDTLLGIENIDASPFNDILIGDLNNNVFNAGNGNDILDGGAGVDTALYSGNRASFVLVKTSSGVTLTDNTGSAGIDTLQNMERLKFADGGIALDVGATQSGGQTQLLLGAVLGKTLLENPANQPLIGVVVDLFDQGYTLTQLAGAIMKLPIWDVFTGQVNPSNTAIANYLLTRVNGVVPDASTLASAAQAIGAESDYAHGLGNFLGQLAQSSANQTQVGLVGLATTGLAFGLVS